jgi:hypothetical protein
MYVVSMKASPTYSPALADATCLVSDSTNMAAVETNRELAFIIFFIIIFLLETNYNA